MEEVQEEIKKLEEQQEEHRTQYPVLPTSVRPTYVGKMSVAMWRNIDRNGNEYYSLKLFGQTIHLFPNPSP